MLRTRSVGRDEGQVDLGLLDVRKLYLGLFGRFPEPLEGHPVLGEVDARVLLELVDEPLGDLEVEVVAAQVGIAVGRLDLEDTLSQLENGDVEGAAAEIVHGDGPLLLLVLVEAIGEAGRRRLVDDPLDFEAGDLARVLGGLALGVVEVGGYRDDGLGDRFSQIVLGRLPHLLENEGADFLGAVHLAADVHADIVAVVGDLVGNHLDLGLELRVPASHEALDGIDGILGVGDHLVLGRLTDDALSLRGESDDRGSRPLTLGIGNDDRLAAFHDRDARIRRTQIYANNPAHIIFSFLKLS